MNLLQYGHPLDGLFMEQYHKIWRQVKIFVTRRRFEVKEDLVKSFYSLDSVGIIHSDPLISKDDERSLQLLKKFVRYRDDGHFETPLLWKFDNFKSARQLSNGHEKTPLPRAKVKREF